MRYPTLLRKSRMKRYTNLSMSFHNLPQKKILPWLIMRKLLHFIIYDEFHSGDCDGNLLVFSMTVLAFLQLFLSFYGSWKEKRRSSKDTRLINTNYVHVILCVEKMHS